MTAPTVDPDALYAALCRDGERLEYYEGRAVRLTRSGWGETIARVHRYDVTINVYVGASMCAGFAMLEHANHISDPELAVEYAVALVRKREADLILRLMDQRELRLAAAAA